MWEKFYGCNGKHMLGVVLVSFPVFQTPSGWTPCMLCFLEIWAKNNWKENHDWDMVLLFILPHAPNCYWIHTNILHYTAFLFFTLRFWTIQSNIWIYVQCSTCLFLLLLTCANQCTRKILTLPLILQWNNFCRQSYGIYQLLVAEPTYWGREEQIQGVGWYNPL